jgi:hypothetical protein
VVTTISPLRIDVLLLFSLSTKSLITNLYPSHFDSEIFARLKLVYINTIMFQNVLSEKKWFDLMTPEDLRAVTPLIYTHVNPYGTFRLDMKERLPLEGELA